MKQSKYVKNWFITLSDIGVYSLVFNLTERWLNYYAINDEMYIFGEQDYDSEEEYQSKIQEVSKFLPDGMYIRSSQINKDQCTFYFIPYKEKDKLIMKSDESN